MNLPVGQTKRPVSTVLEEEEKEWQEEHARLLAAEKNCPWTVELIGYFEGELDKARAKVVTTHLEVCSLCRADLRGRRKGQEMPLEPGPPLPGSFLEEFLADLAAFEQQKAATKPDSEQ